MGFTLFERWSPEYALNNAIEDMKESGVNGLKKHLTSNAIKNLNNMESISSISTVFMGSNAVNVLLEKLSDCDWEIKDVMKGSETSKGVLGFNYEDKMVGTVEMNMIKEDKIWKIDGIEMPKFDKFALDTAE